MPDYGLGRLPEVDSRSANYPVRPLLAALPQQPRSYTWPCPIVLDQGSAPACVGFGWSGWLAAKPVMTKAVDNALGLALYEEAKRRDQYPGEDYDGSSVLGGAKAVKDRGHLLEYRWVSDEPELAVTVSRVSPVVVGSKWTRDMFRVDHDGYVHPTGAVEGGHCWLLIGYNVKLRRYTALQSWGTDWGVNGRFYVHAEDMAALLADDGEACIGRQVKEGSK